MCPLIPEFIQQIDFSKRTQYTAHEARLANGFLDRVEALADDALSAYHTSNGAGYFAHQVEGTGDGLLARRHRMRKRFYRF
jgi:hypothetical protein